MERLALTTNARVTFPSRQMKNEIVLLFCRISKRSYFALLRHSTTTKKAPGLYRSRSYDKEQDDQLGGERDPRRRNK